MGDNQRKVSYHRQNWLSFRLAVTSDLFETLPVDCPDESSIMTYNCNFKGNGCRQR